MEKITCKNCGTEYEGKYCNECGQKATVRRLGWKSLWENLLISLTNVERGFFFTIWHLFTRPGHLMREYLEGKRVSYFKPFALLFILLAVYAFESEVLFSEGRATVRQEKIDNAITEQEILLESLLHATPDTASMKPETPLTVSDTVSLQATPAVPAENTAVKKKTQEEEDDNGWFEDLIEDLVETIMEAIGGKNILTKILTKIFSSPLTLILFTLLSYILNIKWVFWRQAKGYNLVEFFFIGTYMVSQLLVFMILYKPLDYFFFDSTLVYVIAFIGLIAWDYKQFFQIRWRAAIGKTILLYPLSFVVMILFFIIFIVILVGMAHVLKG